MDKKPISDLELNRTKIELGNLKTKLRIQEQKFKDLEADHNELYNDFLKLTTSYKTLHLAFENKTDELAKLRTIIKSNRLLRLLTKRL